MPNNENEVTKRTNKEQRKRMNKILEICKFRKDKNAVACFDDDCQEVKENYILSKNVRRRGDGTIQTLDTKTGNIIFSCDVHNWSELFSVNQLDNMPMPERTTTVTDVIPQVANPESNVVER